MIKNSICTLVLFSLISCGVSNEIKVSPGSKISDRSIIYALPLTNLVINIEVTKTTFKRGIYAEFAEKYLHIQNVPLFDSQFWGITNTKIETLVEADPHGYYTLTYKTYPDNLDKLFSISDKGVILDFTNLWKYTVNKTGSQGKQDSIYDPEIYSPIQTEKIDTFYKTIITDSLFRRIPFIKKQIVSKSLEDEANETASLILKIRKSRIKLLRGKLTYPPDGEALKVNLQELNKLENIYLALFLGMNFEEKKIVTFFVTPKKEQATSDLCYFSADKGIQTQPLPGTRLIALQLNKVNEVQPPVVENGKIFNGLYYRIPSTINAVIKIGNDDLAAQRLPVYQLGSLQVMSLKP